MKAESVKKFAVFSLKILIAGAIIGYMLRDYENLAASFRGFDMKYLLPAMVCYGAHMAVCAWRWRRLAAMLGVELTAFEALSITMQGYFFSLVIPGGAIGGDVVKMGVVSRRSPSGNKMEGAFTVLMDRIVGMIALFLLELVILLPAYSILKNVQLPGLPQNGTTNLILTILLGLLGIAGLAASCMVFFHRTIEKIPLLGWLMHRGDSITHGLVSRLTAATDIYAANWRELGVLTAVSIVFVHLMTVAPMIFLMLGLGVDCPVFTAVAAVTIGNIIGLIPLFPAGVGGRDVAVITLLTAAGIASRAAGTAQFLYTAILLFFNLLGGVFFVFYRTPAGAAAPEPSTGKGEQR